MDNKCTPPTTKPPNLPLVSPRGRRKQLIQKTKLREGKKTHISFQKEKKIPKKTKMERTTKLFSVLVICVIVMAHQAAAQVVLPGTVGKGKELINRICMLTPKTKDLCVEVLSSDPVRSPDADLKDLAIISLRVAAKNASSMLGDVKNMIDDVDLDPEVQQGLADCKETILDAESQLEDTIASLLAEDDDDGQTWLKAALAAITTCDDSIPGNDDVLSVKSAVFRQLCNIAVALTKALPPKRTA